MNYDYCVAEVELAYKPKKTKRSKLMGSDTAYGIIRPTFSEETIHYKECFKAMFLNCANEVVGYTSISEGGITETAVDLRLIFQAALLMNATAVVLAHNHPSGNLRPSIQDRNITRQISEAGRILNIRVLDHLIVGDDTYYSFNDEGLL